MPGELLRDTASGALMRDTASGKLLRATQNLMGADCEFCDPGATPQYITLTLSGLTFCDGCLPNLMNGPPLWIRWIRPPDPNGTWLLEQAVNACHWVFTDHITGTSYWGFNIAGCGGTPTFYAGSIRTIEVWKTGANAVTIMVHVVWGICGSVWMFYADNVPVDSDCINISTPVANEIVTCGFKCTHQGVDTVGQYTGGIATIREGYGPTDHVYIQQRPPISDDVVQWYPGVNNYTFVDDPIGYPDEDATYVTTNVGGHKDLFNFGIMVVPAGSEILNVRVTGRFKRLEAGGSGLVRELIKVDGTVYAGAAQQLPYGLTPEYFFREYAWTTNPASGLPWIPDDVNGVGADPLESFGYECIGYKKLVACTQVFVEVNYIKRG